MDEYELVLGLPHTNHVGLAEHLLLMQAGHFQWTSMARAFGRPLSTLRTASGGEVYATCYYIDLRFPHGRSNADFRLDDRLRFLVSLRSFKGIAVEGRITFDHAARLSSGGGAADDHPHIHFANIFITPDGGNSRLRVAAPVDADVTGLPILPNEENPYHLTQRAAETGDLALFGAEWCAAKGSPVEMTYTIDPDRDSNGAGLLYFANYVAFMDVAERLAFASGASPRPTLRRRVAYYGNAALDGRIRIRAERMESMDDQSIAGIRYTIVRESDDVVICRSEAIKAVRWFGGAQWHETTIAAS